MNTRETLIDEIEGLKSKIDDLQFELENACNDLDELEFTEKDGEELLRTFKRSLEIRGLWNNQLEEQLDMFIKFELPIALNNIINWHYNNL